jgi:hypothetical protein
MTNDHPLATPAASAEPQRARLALTAEAAPAAPDDPAGGFEILAITAGAANGWTFTEPALRASVLLWDGVETFVDHGASLAHRSVRDLGGVCRAPAWDAERQGIRLQLRPFGPSGALVAALGREMLAEADGGARWRPKIGFSADLLFTAGSGRVVQRILRVLSLDLVFDPARGGAFLRALNAAGGAGAARPAGPYPVAALPAARLAQEMHMETEGTTTPAGGPLQAGSHRSSPGQPQVAPPLEGPGGAADAEAARSVRAEMCRYLLDSGLAASRLPAAAQDFIRQQFAGRVFAPGELSQAIEAQRALVAALTSGAVVAGPGRVHAMLSSADRLQAAVDDLLGAPRDPGMETARVHRLSGIRELYHTLTGDYDYHGGYYPEHVQLATTADFTGLVKNALNKIVVNTWTRLGRAGYDWWRRLVTVEHFTSLQSITGTLVGTVGTLPAVAEGAEYTELVVGDSPETASFTKYGGYIPLTLELIDRDDARKLAAYPRELASAGLRKLSALVAAIFTDNAGAGPTMADGGALFNSTAVTTAGGHKNLLTTALSASEWDVVSTAVYNQPLLIKNAAGYYGAGPKLAINPRYLLVPRALQLTGMKILYPTLENAANIYSENQQRGQPGDVITVPEWTDASDWAAACDPDVAPAIFVGERFGVMPEIFVAGDEHSPAVFSNDEHRLKVRQFLAVWVNDFRPLHKSNVA